MPGARDIVQTVLPGETRAAVPGLVNFGFHWPHPGETVLLAGSFTAWDKQPIAMTQESGGSSSSGSGEGVFSTIVALPPGIHTYKFIVDGQWHHDVDQVSR